MIIKLEGITSAALATLGQIFFHSYGPGADKRFISLSDWQVFSDNVYLDTHFLRFCQLPSGSASSAPSRETSLPFWLVPNRNFFCTFSSNFLCSPFQLQLSFSTHTCKHTHMPLPPSLDSSPDQNVPFLLEVSSVVNLNKADSPSLDQSFAKDLRILLHR